MRYYGRLILLYNKLLFYFFNCFWNYFHNIIYTSHYYIAWSGYAFRFHIICCTRTGNIIACKSKSFAKPCSLKVSPRSWFPHGIFRIIPDSHPRRVVLESIQDDGAFAKLKQIILCKLHRISLCFYVNWVAYNNHLNCNSALLLNS